MNTLLCILLVIAIVKSYEKLKVFFLTSLSIYKLLTSSLYCECLDRKSVV